MRVTVLGTGIMGAPMARNIAAAGHDVRAWNRTIEKARGIEGVEAVDDPADAVRDADVVVTATWAKQPILTRDMIAPGTHITAIGADEPGKAELDRALIAVSKFVCDDADLAVEMGALAGVGLGRDAVHCTLGDALRGTRVRTRDEDITVFGSVGLPCQDLPAAWMAYQRARASGTRFHFHDSLPWAPLRAQAPGA